MTPNLISDLRSNLNAYLKKIYVRFLKLNNASKI